MTQEADVGKAAPNDLHKLHKQSVSSEVPVMFDSGAPVNLCEFNYSPYYFKY